MSVRRKRVANTSVETMKQPRAIHRDRFLANTDRQEAFDDGDGAGMIGKPGIFFFASGPSPVTSVAPRNKAVATTTASGVLRRNLRRTSMARCSTSSVKGIAVTSPLKKRVMSSRSFDEMHQTGGLRNPYNSIRVMTLMYRVVLRNGVSSTLPFPKLMIQFVSKTILSASVVPFIPQLPLDFLAGPAGKTGAILQATLKVAKSAIAGLPFPCSPVFRLFYEFLNDRHGLERFWGLRFHGGDLMFEKPHKIKDFTYIIRGKPLNFLQKQFSVGHRYLTPLSIGELAA
jgi:hypothetical protein